MLSRKYLLTSYIFELHPNSKSLPYSLGPLIVIVSLLSFSLLLYKIPVPDVKLCKVSSVLSQAATTFQSIKPGSLPCVKYLGRTLTISLTSNVEHDSMYLSFKDDKVNFYLVFR